MSKEIEQNGNYWYSNYENVYEHIKQCLNEAMIRGIEANAILVKKEFAITQGFYSPELNGVFPSMICGLKVIYTEDKLPFNANFVITKADNVISDFEKLQKENEILKEKLENIKRFFESEETGND